MREILFRGKRIDNGEWVYGDIVHNGVDENNGLVQYKYGDSAICMVDIQDKLCLIRKVYTSTIGQYTGLKDKNDVKIFEGDIVRIIYDGVQNVFVVVWDVDELDFKATNGKEKYGHEGFQYLPCCEEVEVIGNIHDNLELMEGYVRNAKETKPT